MASPSSTVPGVAVIGCGAWGANHVRVLAALGALRAVSDDDPARARTASEAGHAPARELDDILGDTSISGIVVASPDPTHAELGLKALEAGKHVLMEKPLAMSGEDARVLARRAESDGRVLMVGHLLHYHPGFRKLAALVAEGAIGEIRHISAKRLHVTPGRPRHVLWDLASHDVSMIVALCGRLPREVRAFTAAPIAGAPPLAANLLLSMGDGVSADIALSSVHPAKLHQICVAGSDGYAVFEDSRPWAEKLTLYRPGLGAADGPVAGEAVAIEPAEPLTTEDRAFLDAIAGGPPPPSHGGEGVAVVEVVAAAEAAAASGRPVALDSDTRAALEKSIIPAPR